MADTTTTPRRSDRRRRPIGVNSWVWHSPVTDELLDELVPKVAAFGFDLLELPVENLGDWTPSYARTLLDRHQLGASVCAVLPPGRELVDTDQRTIDATTDYLREVIDIAAAVGSPTVVGPMYSSVGRTWRMSESQRVAAYDEVADNLRGPVEAAERAGVRLGIEPLNRFETSVVNTAAQAMEIVDRVGSPHLGVALDTFHTAIEERNGAAAVRTAGDHLVHMQVCGSDRGAPGGDNVDWPALFAALDDVGYDGPVCIESFTAENETIAVAASIWRRLAPTQDQLALDGLAFLKELA